MARQINRDKLLKKIPEQFHGILASEKDFSVVNSLLRMEATLLGPMLIGIEAKFKPIVQYMIESKSPKVKSSPGKKSVLPYSKEDIARASALMKKRAGDKIMIDNEEYELSSIMVLVKVKVGEKIKTIAISKLMGEE